MSISKNTTTSPTKENNIPNINPATTAIVENTYLRNSPKLNQSPAKNTCSSTQSPRRQQPLQALQINQLQSEFTEETEFEEMRKYEIEKYFKNMQTPPLNNQEKCVTENKIIINHSSMLTIQKSGDQAIEEESISKPQTDRYLEDDLSAQRFMGNQKNSPGSESLKKISSIPKDQILSFEKEQNINGEQKYNEKETINKQSTNKESYIQVSLGNIEYNIFFTYDFLVKMYQSNLVIFDCLLFFKGEDIFDHSEIDKLEKKLYYLITIGSIGLNILASFLTIFYFIKAVQNTVYSFYFKFINFFQFQEKFNGYWVAFLTFLFIYIILCIQNPQFKFVKMQIQLNLIQTYLQHLQDSAPSIEAHILIFQYENNKCFNYKGDQCQIFKKVLSKCEAYQIILDYLGNQYLTLPKISSKPLTFLDIQTKLIHSSISKYQSLIQRLKNKYKTNNELIEIQEKVIYSPYFQKQSLLLNYEQKELNFFLENKQIIYLALSFIGLESVFQIIATMMISYQRFSLNKKISVTDAVIKTNN